MAGRSQRDTHRKCHRYRHNPNPGQRRAGACGNHSACWAFRFAPLETVKRVDLIASIDTSGREMFNALVAVWPASGSYRYAILPSDAHGVLARDVVDLDGAGVHKIVAGTFPGGYQGVDTIPIPWYGVYTLKQGKWIEVRPISGVVSGGASSQIISSRSRSRSRVRRR